MVSIPRDMVDVLVKRDGQVRGAVIDFGGFLGVGSRKIVVDWSALHFGQVTNKKESITLELTLEQVKADLAKTVMKINSVKELAGMKASADALPAPPIEPAGKAAPGMSYQQ